MAPVSIACLTCIFSKKNYCIENVELTESIINKNVHDFLMYWKEDRMLIKFQLELIAQYSFCFTLQFLVCGEPGMLVTMETTLSNIMNMMGSC